MKLPFIVIEVPKFTFEEARCSNKIMGMMKSEEV